MGLQPLEFSDCLTDSPYFREILHTHEKELDRTSKSIKVLINECKDLVNTAKALSKAQRTFSKNLMEFKFECTGSEQTEDEECIANALGEFGKLIALIEDERDRMMEKVYEQIITPLEVFRKDRIGSAKDGKKKFDKQTGKFCTSLEKYLAMKTKVSENMLSDADVQVDMERRQFYQASMEYVLLLQEVQETKKFEFVEILLRFIYQWLTFYHVGHDVSEDFKPYMSELQQRLQKCRTNYDTTRLEAQNLMHKMLEVRGTKPQDHQTAHKCTREGYLYLLEKKAIGTTWNKYYCQYKKENKIFTMIPYSQVTGKGVSGITTDTMMLLTCTRRASDSIEKRFCFDLTVQDRTAPLTVQALSDDDRKLWMDAMDGKEPIYNMPINIQESGSLLDDIGFTFINKCINAIEANGLEEQGLYRVVGVSSKVTKLTNMGLDRRKADRINFNDKEEWEVKTITSALKNYFRNLPEPLMTFKLHSSLVAAAKRESKTLRLADIHEFVHLLPEQNFEMLALLIEHLRKLADHSDKNLMSVPNLGVCFGPTLMRPKEETMAAIMDIKWCNIVVEILIDNFEKIFTTAPDSVDVSNTRVLPSNNSVISSSSSSLTTTTLPPAVNAMSASSPPVFNNTNSISGSDRDRMDSVSSTSSKSGQPIYANSAAGGPGDSAQTYAQYRAKLRPTGGIYSQFSPGDHNSSRSSSTDSLNSRSSSTHHSNSSINNHHHAHHSSGSPAPNEHRKPPLMATVASPGSQAANRYSQATSVPKTDTSSSTSSVSSVSSGQHGRGSGKRVRTLYLCEAENTTELSFEPNQIICNVRPSREPGWLEGYLDGRTGLIPANYVEYLN